MNNIDQEVAELTDIAYQVYMTSLEMGESREQALESAKAYHRLLMGEEV
jgi:hypothetical protein